MVSGSIEFGTFSCSPKAAVLTVTCFHGALFMSSTFFFLKLLIGFYFFNLAGNVKMH